MSQVLSLFERLAWTSAASEGPAKFSALSQRRWLQGTASTGQKAFAFDIDGVLVKGKGVLTQAKRALAHLYDQGTRSQLWTK